MNKLPHDHGNYDEELRIQRELKNTEKYEKSSKILSMLSDPVRLKIYWILVHREECVINLASMVNMSSPAISHHLSKLTESGLIECRRDGKEVYYRAIRSDLNSHLHEMLDSIMEIACPEDSINGRLPREEVIKNIHEYLNENLDRHITISELSKKFLMNQTTLKSEFKRAYGMSIGNHMKVHRMEKAAKLLATTHLSISEVARLVGYESQSRFTEIFKEVVGLLPTEYRKRPFDFNTEIDRKLLKPIVLSLLDTDLYKFNMNQVMFHKYKDLEGEYVFKCRDENVVFTQEMVNEISRQIELLSNLKFTEDEISYLKSMPTFKPDYIDFLRGYSLDGEAVSLSLNPNGSLNLRVKGKLYLVMQFEIYLLGIVNEVYFRFKYDYDDLLSNARLRLDEKIKALNSGKFSFNFAEFGARRRLSAEFQGEMIKRFKDETTVMVGTSNVYFAMKYGLKPIGTFAHEFVQMYQGLGRIKVEDNNRCALDDWYEEYQGAYSIALTDTLTTDYFLKTFNEPDISRYVGLRSDSGDPFIWGEKIIDFYRAHNVDTKSKTLLFSDSLDFDKAERIYNRFKDEAIVSFGIGTYLSNDTGKKPLNIVMKLQYVNGRPVAKLTDDMSKSMSQDEEYLENLKQKIMRSENNKA